MRCGPIYGSLGVKRLMASYFCSSKYERLVPVTSQSRFCTKSLEKVLKVSPPCMPTVDTGNLLQPRCDYPRYTLSNGRFREQGAVVSISDKNLALARKTIGTSPTLPCVLGYASNRRRKRYRFRQFVWCSFGEVGCDVWGGGLPPQIHSF